MLKQYTAFTNEIDDPELAAKEILDQLNPKENMLKNTLGLVFFHYEFVLQEKLEIILKAMPFEIAGCMSNYNGINGQHGDVALTITMITGDDITFKVKTIDDIKNKTIRELRVELRGVIHDELCKDDNPKLIIPFMPTLPHFCGNDLMHSVNRYDSSLMLFGIHVFNIDGVPDTHYVVGEGKIHPSMLAMIAFYGDVDPKFRISSSFTFTEKFGETVEITDADLSTMKSVNNITALEYLKRNGLISSDNVQSMASLIAVPAILTYKNGSQVPCAFIGIDEKNEWVMAARTLEKGAKIIFSHLDGEKTLASAKDLIKEIDEVQENDFIIFSSAARAWATGSNLFSEMQIIQEEALKYEKIKNKKLNYSIAYSSGEICPLLNEEGKYYNMVHNYTLIACTFN